MDSRPSTALVSRGPEGTTPRITDLELRSPTRNTCSCRQPGCSRRAWGAQAIHHGLLCFAPCPPTAVHQVRRRRRRRQRDTSGWLLAGLWLVSGHGQGISPSRTTCPSGTIGMLVALPRGVWRITGATYKPWLHISGAPSCASATRACRHQSGLETTAGRSWCGGMDGMGEAQVSEPHPGEPALVGRACHIFRVASLPPSSCLASPHALEQHYAGSRYNKSGYYKSKRRHRHFPTSPPMYSAIASIFSSCSLLPTICSPTCAPW